MFLGAYRFDEAGRTAAGGKALDRWRPIHQRPKMEKKTKEKSGGIFKWIGIGLIIFGVGFLLKKYGSSSAVSAAVIAATVSVSGKS